MKIGKIEVSFINYRKEYNGHYPINGWFPEFNKYWIGDIWQISWRGFAISLDKRKNWLADMINPMRKMER